ncbi:MAG: ribosome maturation factor RimP [Oligoflexia bacterium]|nr:ribosome maturation factor RimP [Oligoflexia bacterium]
MSEKNLTDRLIDLITPLTQPLGYEIVHLETHLGRQKVLRLFIDCLDGKTVGIEDCVKVTKALDEPLDQLREIEQTFPGGYELEVSSPGVDRPLRKPTDYERFAGREIRIHVFRPLTGEELSNAAYQLRNPKQKNFLGTLVGLRADRVLMAVPSGKAGKKPAKKAQNKHMDVKNSAAGEPDSRARMTEEVTIPLPLIAKANLEPQFSLERTSAGKESET